MTADRTASDECELLFELETRETGPLHLGRFLRGTHSGRLVVLRPVEAGLIESSVRSVEASRGIAHPRLGKVIGFVDIAARRYIASEYIEGCTLAELVQAAKAGPGSVGPAVAARVVLDALQAVIAGRRLLTERDAPPDGRCFHADAVWIAEFGETFLLEIGIVHHLGRAAPNPELEHLDGEDGDVMAAGAALLELLGGAQGDLERIAARALSANRANAYDGPEAMVKALAELPKGVVATEKEVSKAVHRLLGQTFERRKLKLDMLKRDWVADFGDIEGESTQFYQTAELVQAKGEDTIRPPAPASPAAGSRAAGNRPVPLVGPAEDEQTRAYQTTTSGDGVVLKEIGLSTRDAGAIRPLSPGTPAHTGPAPAPSPNVAPRRRRSLFWVLLIGFVLGAVADRLHLGFTTSSACREQLWPSSVLGIRAR